MRVHIELPQESIEAFCKKWDVVELSLFGSALREDFRPDSDVDVMVEFAPGVHLSLFDMVRMEDELREIFGREVDLVVKSTIARSRNPLRRKAILDASEVIYAV